jgi:cytochrome c oxidase subunit III
MLSAALRHDFQYATSGYQAETAIAGMWLFLATEVLFFGGLILSWIYSRHWNAPGFDAGAQHTALWAGTLNTAILLSSSLTYAIGIVHIRLGHTRGLIRYCAATLLLGLAFLTLKFGVEWHDDFVQHLFPTDPRFAILGSAAGGARLFYVFYFVSTGLHGLHMLIGVALLLWIMRRAGRGHFSSGYNTPVLAVGLYWSFVDIVWITLYPLIYLIGRSS